VAGVSAGLKLGACKPWVNWIQQLYSPTVRVLLRDSGASCISKAGTHCKSSPLRLSVAPAACIRWFKETSGCSSDDDEEDETGEPPSSSDDASLAIVAWRVCR
jgi:hypothetical protein